VISQFPTVRRSHGPAAALARNPIGVAWIVIWLSFAVFAALLVAAVGAGLHYVATAVRPMAATLANVSEEGTVLVQEPAWPRPEAVRPSQPLYTGDVVYTDAFSTAQIGLPDGSSVHLYPGTALQLTQLDANRYHWLSGPRRIISMALQTGKLEATVTRFPASGSTFDITALGAKVSIADGATDVWLSQPRVQGTPASDSSPAPAFTNSCCATQVLTQNGSAIVSGSGAASVLLQGDQRTMVPMGGTPLGVLAPTWDLLANGSFHSVTSGLPDDWEVRQEAPNGQQSENRIALTDGSTPSLHLWATGDPKHAAHHGIYFKQQVGRDVRDFLSLDLVVSFRVRSQSLPGGGYAGSEYPFRVTVDYVPRSKPDSETQWFAGYYVLPPFGDFVVDPQAKRVLANQWFPTNQDQQQGALHLSGLPDPPLIINWVEFSASGWNFDTDVRSVQLLAQ